MNMRFDRIRRASRGFTLGIRNVVTVAAIPFD